MGGMSQSKSVIESEHVEEESDEEDQEARDQCQNEEVRSRQGGTEEQTQVEDQVEERTFHHHCADGSQGTRDDANQEAREPHSTRRQREVPRQDAVNDCECKCTRMAEGACQDQLSFPAMQVTSSHVSFWFDFPASYDEYTALVKFGNVASEHVKSAISIV